MHYAKLPSSQVSAWLKSPWFQHKDPWAGGFFFLPVESDIRNIPLSLTVTDAHHLSSDPFQISRDQSYLHEN